MSHSPAPCSRLPLGLQRSPPDALMSPASEDIQAQGYLPEPSSTLDAPGLPPQAVPWAVFPAVAEAVAGGHTGCTSPGESGLVSRASQGLRSPLESRRGSLGAP